MLAVLDRSAPERLSVRAGVGQVVAQREKEASVTVDCYSRQVRAEAAGVGRVAAQRETGVSVTAMWWRSARMPVVRMCLSRRVLLLAAVG